jgi:urease gamma subunit
MFQGSLKVAGVDGQTSVPGQTVLPGMAGDLGYDSIKLKPWEERFCWKYVELGVAVRAYQAVKPKSTYSTAGTESAKLLKKPEIQARIAEIQEEIGREARALVMGYHRAVMTTDRISLLQKVRDAKSYDDLDEEARAILEFEQVNSKDGVRTLLKVPTRDSSAKELARIQGMHKDKVELTGKDGGPLEHEHKYDLTDEMLAKIAVGG